MSLANNQTFQLWQSFMPRRLEIVDPKTGDLFSMQVYPPTFDFTFNQPHMEFDKWAALEVVNFDDVPQGMETFMLEGGLYAVFDYQDLSTDTRIFQYIFGGVVAGVQRLLLGKPTTF